MIQLLSETDEKKLKDQLNSLGPHLIILSIYAINQKHFAWVRLSEQSEAQAPRAKTKGTK